MYIDGSCADLLICTVLQARELAEVINSGIQPLQNLKTLQAFGDKKAEWAKTVIANGFEGTVFLQINSSNQPVDYLAPIQGSVKWKEGREKEKERFNCNFKKSNPVFRQSADNTRWFIVLQAGMISLESPLFFLFFFFLSPQYVMAIKSV